MYLYLILYMIKKNVPIANFNFKVDNITLMVYEKKGKVPDEALLKL